jgi:hypothetical protein
VTAALLLGACGSFTEGAQVNELETRNAQLQATIDVIGTPAATIVALQMTADRALVMQAEMNGVQGTALAVQSTLTALQLNGGVFVAQPTTLAPSIQGTPLGGGQPAGGVTPAPSSGSAPTTFSQTTTATGVREADGCAAGGTSIFEATEDEIYVVTMITNLKAGAVFGARWLAEGSLFHDDTRCWIPAEDWASVCAWCSIVSDGGRFEPGNWTVELMLNGQLLSQAQFQVVDSSAATPGEEATAP